MIATFYLLAESFAYNASFSREDLELKANALAADFALIKKHKDTNKLWVHPEIYDVAFIDKVTIADLLYKEEIAGNHLDRDARVSLQRIIVESPELTDYTAEKVIKELLPKHDENTCNGLIAFNTVANVQPELQVVYNINGWYEFRRYFLSLYPKNADFYIEECMKYFPKLTFHTQNKISIEAILPTFAQSIVKHLGYLNDIFYGYRLNTFSNESAKYRAFSVECQLEEYAAAKDKNAAKGKLTYHFQNEKGDAVPVICYPHLRLCKSDKDGDSKYYYNRIYFHEGIKTIDNENILVGHIGVHL